MLRSETATSPKLYNKNCSSKNDAQWFKLMQHATLPDGKINIDRKKQLVKN